MPAATPDQPAAEKGQVFQLVTFRKEGPNATATVVSNAFEPEDEYRNFYAQGSLATEGTTLLEPPYNLRTLDRLSQENNALGPCIEAMVNNVDGTGFTFDRPGDEAGTAAALETDAKIEALLEFFAEPWPGESFIAIRRELRRELERVGNAYLEVIRNAAGEIVFLRRVDAKMIRLVKLDEAVPVAHEVSRGGRPITVQLKTRERRFAQIINGNQLVFFKAFGASRDLDKNNAEWAAPGTFLPADRRATEIIHFSNLPDAHTPYGVPRWIAQLPSVLGSRKAEEFNLDFFDNGGVPPVMILLQGGTMTPETRRAIEQKTSGSAAANNRVMVIEAEPTGGSLDSPGTARITVERFGAERQADSMFELYDSNAELRIRRAFRLPPIFVGQAADYSFATAYTSYTVTEAQVFKPERDEFDKVMTIKLLPALGYPGYKMRSLPLVITDANQQLAGIQVAQLTNRVEPEEVVAAVNGAVGLNLRPSAGPVLPVDPVSGAPVRAQTTAGQRAGTPSDPVTTPNTKAEEAIDLV